jgi:hypothetical protein
MLRRECNAARVAGVLCEGEFFKKREKGQWQDLKMELYDFSLPFTALGNRK